VVDAAADVAVVASASRTSVRGGEEASYAEEANTRCVALLEYDSLNQNRGADHLFALQPHRDISESTSASARGR
jgi:hypothetical protein